VSMRTGPLPLSALAHPTLVWPEASDFLYGVPFYDPATFIALPLFVDPNIALRYE
jgi:hypothetical protein